VEKTLNAHPAVQESAVVGYTDANQLTTPYAFVVAAAGYTPSEELTEAIKTFAKERIAVYKYPRRIKFIDKIPRTSRGKIKRFVLQEKVKL
jgi:acyl-coenzyme A synthetase/AMP-(fatty) acid ligase